MKNLINSSQHSLIIQDDSRNNSQLRRGAKLIKQEPEYKFLRRFIYSGAVVFDVGANIGCWSMAVTEGIQDVSLHLFEPALPTFEILNQNAMHYFSKARLQNLAIGARECTKQFFFYDTKPTWSGFYRRRDEEAKGTVGKPTVIPVQSVTLDRYCQNQNVKHINLLKIDVEGAEIEVMQGASGLLTAGAVDALQFEYGGTFIDAAHTLRSVYDFLTSRDYVLYIFDKNAPIPISHWTNRLEDYRYANYLAIHRRLTGWLEGRQPAMIDLAAHLSQENIRPRGVIHVGAHEGRELTNYRKIGASPIIFVEANPAVAARLRQRMSDEPDVIVVECAVTDGATETVTLHVTSMDQSSSVLPLKEHLQIYPEIVEVSTVTVPAKTLDKLISDLGYNPETFNFLNIDIQGAELQCLRGATATLPHIAAINTEINFRELYAGGVLSHELDAFLKNFGFIREATVCPYHPSWGDALYIKRSVISMSSLGNNGRFANQLFQYAFLKHYALQHQLIAEVPPWVGNTLFGTHDPAPRRAYPRLHQSSTKADNDAVINANPPLRNVDIWGYFQFPGYYASPQDQNFFRKLFSPVPPIKAKILRPLANLLAGKSTLVAVHLRRGDYGYEHFFVAPSKWYLEWLEHIWGELQNPILYIASDEPNKVLSDFSEYQPISRADLGDLGNVDTICPCYPDFYVLSKADILAISNSSFSFAAAMLNKNATVFMRPRLGQKKLIPFDPFNSPVIFRDETVRTKDMNSNT